MRKTQLFGQFRADTVMKWLAVAGLLGLRTATATAALPDCEAGGVSDKSVIGMTSSKGDRVQFGLQRDGDSLRGMAYLWQKDGRIVANGPVSGRLGGKPPVEGATGFVLTAHWHPPVGGSNDFSGWIERGGGKGIAHGMGPNGGPVNVDIRTASRCPKWPQEYFVGANGRAGVLPAPAYQCVPGFVWREATKWDRVCVLPAARDRVAAENRIAPSLREGRGNNQCNLPYFARSAVAGDTACVALQARALAVSENEAAHLYVINKADVLLQEHGSFCNGYAGEAVAAAERNRSNKCGDSGPRWEPSASPHFDWCMNNQYMVGAAASEQRASVESDARAVANIRCANRTNVTETSPLAKARPSVPQINLGAVQQPTPSARDRVATSMATATPLPAARSGSANVVAATTCRPGLVWREARASDHVCVDTAARARTALENRTAAERRDPTGSYGPNSCKAGFVWREAFAGDLVCVTPEARKKVREENLH